MRRETQAERAENYMGANWKRVLAWIVTIPLWGPIVLLMLPAVMMLLPFMVLAYALTGKWTWRA